VGESKLILIGQDNRNKGICNRGKKNLTTPISVVGDLCFNACFSQLEPKPPSGGQTKKRCLKRARQDSIKEWVVTADTLYSELDSHFNYSGYGSEELFKLIGAKLGKGLAASRTHGL
jgi:hypothetical protein